MVSNSSVSGRQIPLIDDGDSILTGMVLLRPISIRPMSVASMDTETLKYYRRTRYHALKVYPYAREALERLSVLDSVAAQADRRKESRQYRKELEKELKKEFSEDIRNLSRTQGSILISMLERQTNRPFYDLLKDLKNGLNANFWNALGKTYGYNLRQAYDPGEDPILEMILSDLQWPDYQASERIVKR